MQLPQKTFMDERIVQNFHHENNQKVRNSCCVSFLRIIYQILVKHVVGGGAVHEHRASEVVLQVPFELGRRAVAGATIAADSVESVHGVFRLVAAEALRQVHDDGRLGGCGTAHRLAHAGLGHAPAGAVVCHQHPYAVPTATMRIFKYVS